MVSNSSEKRNCRRPVTGEPQRRRQSRVAPFVVFFFLFLLLLGGGSLVQVLRWHKEVREARRPAPLPEERPARPLVPALPDADTLYERYRREQEARVQDEFEHIEEQATPGPTVQAQVGNRDLVRLALDYYGTLDRGLLEMLEGLNPDIEDWNALDRARVVVLPAPAPFTSEPTGPVDIVSVELTTLGSRSTAVLAAERLDQSGGQNIFVIPDRDRQTGQRRFRLCMGIFTSEHEASGAAVRMKNAGFPLAKPVDIREPSLARIIHPYWVPPPRR